MAPRIGLELQQVAPHGDDQYEAPAERASDGGFFASAAKG